LRSEETPPINESPRRNSMPTCGVRRLEGLSNPIGTPEREGCFHATPTLPQGVGVGRGEFMSSYYTRIEELDEVLKRLYSMQSRCEQLSGHQHWKPRVAFTYSTLITSLHRKTIQLQDFILHNKKMANMKKIDKVEMLIDAVWNDFSRLGLV